MASKQKQKPDLVLDGAMPRGYRCPKCGSAEWSPGSFHYEPGWLETTYTCWHESHGKQCGFKVMERERVPDLIWVSPNNNWLIYEENLPLAPDYDNDYSTVARVTVSDGYTSGTMDINVKGQVQYDSNVLYGSPQYVRDRAESILNKKWKSMVQPSRKASRNGKANDTRGNGKPLWASKDNRWTIFEGDDNITVGLKGIVATVTVHKDGRFNIVSIDDRGEIKQWCATPDIPIYVMNEVIRILVGMTKGKTPVYSENRRRGNGPLGSRSILSEFEQIRRRLGEERFSHIEAFLAEHPRYDLSDIYYDIKVWNEFEGWEGRKFGKKADKNRRSRR